MKTIHDLLRRHRLFQTLPAEQLELIAGCGQNVHFKADSFIAHTGEPADTFYVLRSGLVAVEIHLPPKQRRRLQTLHAGDIMGWSWIFPPYKWTFDLVTIEDSSAVALDGACLRKKCEANPAMGYQLMKVFAQIMSDRLRATRLQLMDVYSHD